MSSFFHSRRLRVWLILFGTGLYFFANIQRVAIPGAIFNLLQEDLRLSAPGVTALGSSFMYVYALNQLVIGLFVNRYGGRRVVLPGALLFCLGSLLFPFSDGVWLYFSRALTGFGASSIYLSLIDETIRTFRKNYTIAVSLVIMAGYAGGIVANAPFVAGVRVIGWQMMLELAAAATVLFYVLFAAASFARKLPPVRRDVPLRFSHFSEVLKNGHNRALFIFSGVNFGLYYVIQTVIGKKFLEDFCGFSSPDAAWILSLTGAISAGAGVLFAVLSRMAGNRRRIFCRAAGMVCVTVFGLITLFVFLGINSGWIALLFCLLAFTGSISSITIPLLHETNPRDLAGPAVCFMNFSFYLAVALFGNMVGLLLNVCEPEPVAGALVYPRGSYLAVFAALALCSAAVFVCSMKMRETNGRRFGEGR
ncbi:MAG: MFS transporter [Lentisphaeria bacterium]|nr:MFS transporter [Lentisphaeria bacterium]